MDAFDAISDGTNITRSKPDPEVFGKAAGDIRILCGREEIASRFFLLRFLVYAIIQPAFVRAIYKDSPDSKTE